MTFAQLESENKALMSKGPGFEFIHLRGLCTEISDHVSGPWMLRRTVCQTCSSITRLKRLLSEWQALRNDLCLQCCSGTVTQEASPKRPETLWPARGHAVDLGSVVNVLDIFGSCF